jgi:hypothetical protein
MAAILRGPDRGPIGDVVKKHKGSEQTICVWCRRLGELEPADVKRLHELDTDKASATGWSRRETCRRVGGFKQDQEVSPGSPGRYELRRGHHAEGTTGALYWGRLRSSKPAAPYSHADYLMVISTAMANRGPNRGPNCGSRGRKGFDSPLQSCPD